MLHKIKVLLYVAPVMTLFTAIMGTLSLIVSLFSSTGITQHKMARFWSRVLLRIGGIRVKVEGVEKIAPGGSYVFIANHRSYFDVPCILPHIPVQFRFVANKNLFSVPFIGFHLKRAGHLAVDSSNARESLKSMAEAGRIIQERNVSVLVFPEGARTRGELLPFKDGAAFVAIKAGVPIVPIALLGTREILPLGSFWLRGGLVTMKIGDPIPTLDMSLLDRTRLSQALREAISECDQEPLPAGQR